MRIGRRNALILPAALVCVVALVLPVQATAQPGAAPSASTTAPERWSGLSPGQFKEQRQRVPVNVVLVGYDKAEVRKGVLAQLPASSEPVVRYPRFYGLAGRDLGLRFDYRYNVIDTPRSFEDAFFGRLKRTGVSTDRTSFQTDYNDQKNNVRDVSKRILTIDAPSTERYLEGAARSQLGVDTRRGYTVFLVNWWGRKDFQFHVYRKTDEPDPDTGYNFGAVRDSRAMIAWGGSSGRSWFYDLSAGPEAWSNNWNVDDADLDGNGQPDYRMPPIWEYVRNGYRSRSELGADLGKVVRYIAINLLFTSSPLYDPLVTAPKPGGAKRVPVTMFEDDPGSRGTDWIDLAESRKEWRQLEPYHHWRTGLRDVDPIDDESKRSLNIWAGLDDSDDCWNDFGDPFAQLYCSFDARRREFLPASGRDYVVGVFAFNTTDAALGNNAGLLGYADDNWVDGTQSYVFEFLTPETRAAGFGFTTTTTHEVGHHLGLSHPHDGYDSETGVDYGPADEFQYVWTGDESDTVMQYLAVSNGFGVFDKDNMARYQFAGYLNWANTVLGALDGVELSGADRARLRVADRLAIRAERAFQSWQPIAAAGYARTAYEIVQRVADEAGVTVDPAAAAQRRAGGLPAPDKSEPRPYVTE